MPVVYPNEAGTPVCRLRCCTASVAAARSHAHNPGVLHRPAVDLFRTDRRLRLHPALRAGGIRHADSGDDRRGSGQLFPLTVFSTGPGVRFPPII